jgi:hypothetical protein
MIDFDHKIITATRKKGKIIWTSTNRAVWCLIERFDHENVSSMELHRMLGSLLDAELIKHSFQLLIYTAWNCSDENHKVWGAIAVGVDEFLWGEERCESGRERCLGDSWRIWMEQMGFELSVEGVLRWFVGYFIEFWF